VRSELAVGFVRTTFGVRGEVKVESYSGEYEHIARLARMKVRVGRSTETLEVESVRIAGQLAIVKFAGIDAKETAARLRGAEIVASRDEAAPLGPGEFYYADLVGMKVCVEGRERGEVVGILDSAGQAMLDVSTPAGRRVVPFVAHFVGEVDLGSGAIEILAAEILE
jgi:16S rRNA processing protein RimM